MYIFLLVVQALIAAAMVGVILMQRSEGGGLGMGGSPTGLMSARGAADFLTRATTILATIFVGLSITMAVLAARQTAPGAIDTSLARAPGQGAQLPTGPTSDNPLAAVAGSVPPAVPMAATTDAPVVVSPKVEARPVVKTVPTVSATAAPRVVAKPVVKPVDVPKVAPTMSPAMTMPSAPVSTGNSN